MTITAEAILLKRAELIHEDRVRLRRKVGVFFGRDAEDIPDDQKRPKEEVQAAKT